MWLGPAMVVGLQGNSNLWLVYGGKCYLVAQEHCREAIGEEALFGRPEVQEALKVFQEDKSSWEKKYQDLTGTRKPQEGDLDCEMVEDGMELDDDADEIFGDDDMGTVSLICVREENPPEDLFEKRFERGWHSDKDGNPFLVSFKAYGFRIPGVLSGPEFTFRSSWVLVNGRWFLLEDDVRWAQLENPQDVLPGGPTEVLITRFKTKSRKQQCLDSVPESVKQKRAKVHETFMTASKRKAQKALDKEIPYHLMSEDMKPAFQEAIDKEWASWCQYEAAAPLDADSSRKVIAETPERVLKSRYVLRNKNAGLVDGEGNSLPLKAKARLCVQGQFDPDCLTGEVKLDSPTVQHTTLLVFLHAVVSFGWLDQWKCGDISSAFLQGKPSEGPPLYMYQPKQGIPGANADQILVLKRPVYGRPDAPRAWYESLSGFIMKDLGYEKSILDPAFFIRRNQNGSPTSMIVIHVDDLMVAGEKT